MAKPTSSTVETLNHQVPLSAMPLISPSALLYAHLTQQPSTRPSARPPNQPRPINLNTSSLTHTNGSSLVRIGDTTVVCGVRAEILLVAEIANYRVRDSGTVPSFNPAPEEDGEYAQDEDYTPITKYNLLVPNLDLTTGCSPLYPPNSPPSATQQSLTTRLASLLHSTRLVRPADLEIHYTPPPELIPVSESATADEEPSTPPQPELRAYWTLYIDLVTLSHSSIGATFDAAWLALLAALTDTLLPAARWDPDTERIICSPESDEAKRLQLRGCPVPLSWCTFVPERRIRPPPTSNQIQNNDDDDEEERYLLVDPDGFEESCCAETGTVTVDFFPARRATRSSFASWEGESRIVKLENTGGGGGGGGLGKLGEMRDMVKLAEKRWWEWQGLLGKGPGRAGIELNLK